MGKQGGADCPVAVQVTPDSNPEAQKVQATVTIEKALEEATLSHYAVYWGRQSCATGGQTGAKNGFIKEIPVGEPAQLEITPDVFVPTGTNHILVFAKGKYGESEHCVSVEFADRSLDGKAEL